MEESIQNHFYQYKIHHAPSNATYYKVFGGIHENIRDEQPRYYMQCHRVIDKSVHSYTIEETDYKVTYT